MIYGTPSSRKGHQQDYIGLYSLLEGKHVRTPTSPLYSVRYIFSSGVSVQHVERFAASCFVEHQKTFVTQRRDEPARHLKNTPPCELDVCIDFFLIHLGK